MALLCARCRASLLAVVALLLAARPTHAQGDEAQLGAHGAAARGASNGLTQLLQWSLDHTDLEALHERAEAIRDAGGGGEGNVPIAAKARSAAAPLTPERLSELRQFVDTALTEPNLVELMGEALAVATNATVDMSIRRKALLNLQEWVEDIDAAKDLRDGTHVGLPNGTSGYTPLLRLLAGAASEGGGLYGGLQDADKPPADPKVELDVLGIIRMENGAAAEAAASESLQEVAAWVLGTAVQNAAEMQDHLVELKSVQLLLFILSKSSSADLHAKVRENKQRKKQQKQETAK